MKIVIIGGSGLIGSKLVQKLRTSGQEVLAASPAYGVDAFSGEGLLEAIQGADVVVDVVNSPVFDDAGVMKFFETSGHNLMSVERAAQVKHHITLSIVGTESLNDSGYMRAKLRQEELVKHSGIPYTIIHSTQFFEFIGGIAQSGVIGDSIHISPALIQPISADELVSFIERIVLASPRNGTVEIAGPEQVPMTEIVSKYLKLKNDPRVTISDIHSKYFGAHLTEESLLPKKPELIGHIKYQDWISIPGNLK